MQLAEQLALLDIGKQERRELLGEHIQWGHRVPGLGGHFILGVTRWRNTPEVGFGEEADLIVVVEHHTAVAGHAEVL